MAGLRLPGVMGWEGHAVPLEGEKKQSEIAAAIDRLTDSAEACCAADLATRVMIVGHHVSKTSSRRALLDAVSASIFVVSSGPTKYGSVTLPDQEVIRELTSSGQVFRTDQDDQSCAKNPAKIGPDADGRAGGCDNIRIVISDSSPIQVSAWHGSD